ncbi:sensor histidine kinase, partial [bacterium]|nr:sensor histidine kinase [bacterium]
NPKFTNKSILEAIKLDNNLYAFLSTSLEPIDSTAKILKEQLIIISILILSLSLLIGYFISKRLSKPIVDISRKANLIAKGKIKKEFTSDSDILEIEDLNNSLNEMMVELGKTEELEKDLLANVSHDLKTPLTMIRAYAEMVRDLTYNNKEKRDSNLNIIIEETDRLTLLVNDILALSKLQQSMDNLVLSEFDLIILIKNILKRFTIYEEKYGYKIIFKHTNIRKLIIKADQKKIEQVLYNLIINAINYTGDDMTVVINISKVNNLYKVEVIDSGKGIDKKDLDSIFDKYYKSEKKHKRNLYGTGLGLSIVKSIFILHNYEYGVDTKKEKGSSFYFYVSKIEK